MSPASKAQQKAVNKYMKENYDRVNLVMPKGRKDGEKRLAQMAVRVFGCQMDFDDPKRTALEGIEAFRAFLRSIGMPLTFAEIGADPADIPSWWR